MIEQNNFQTSADHRKKPLMIGSSGGSGHIRACQALCAYLKKQYGEAIFFEEYQADSSYSTSKVTPLNAILRGKKLLDSKAIKSDLHHILLSYLGLPILPNYDLLEKEIKELYRKQNETPRSYIDMLLDVYANSYVLVTIWNYLQRTEQTAAMAKLVHFQSLSNQQNYHVVYNYFLEKLKLAEKLGAPYTEIISTQPMGIPALCDAVQAYNDYLNAEKKSARPLIIHQYMTDLPGKGAEHFFKSLASLSKSQQQLINLYAVNLSEDVLKFYFPKGHHFHGTFNINPKNNPLLRSGFTDPKYDNSQKYDVDLDLNLCGKPIKIPQKTNIATIVLGSQGSTDAIDYIEILLTFGVDKIFVLGGNNDLLKPFIHALILQHPEHLSKIIPLDSLDDGEMSSLLTRSNYIFQRGGGLSIMEALAMPHNANEQTILFHHHRKVGEQLTSGFMWEDENVSQTIAEFNKSNVHAVKTSPEQALRDLYEAQILLELKKQNISFDCNLLQELHYFSMQTLKQCNAWIKQGDVNSFTSYFIPYGKDGSTERRYLQTCEKLLTATEECREHLETIIREEFFKSRVEGSSVVDTKIELNVNKIINNLPPAESKHHSTRLLSAVKSYRALDKLAGTINPQQSLSPRTRVINFMHLYQDQTIKDDLLSFEDSVIKRFIHKVTYELAKLFNFNTCFNKFLKPEYKLAKEVEMLNSRPILVN